jgi:hypothetical protein
LHSSIVIPLTCTILLPLAIFWILGSPLATSLSVQLALSVCCLPFPTLLLLLASTYTSIRSAMSGRSPHRYPRGCPRRHPVQAAAPRRPPLSPWLPCLPTPTAASPALFLPLLLVLYSRGRFDHILTITKYVFFVSCFCVFYCLQVQDQDEEWRLVRTFFILL